MSLASLTRAGGPPGRTPDDRTPDDRVAGRRRRAGTAYLLLLPGGLCLLVLFVLPLVTLFATSLQTRVPGGEIGQFEQTFRFANYPDALNAYLDQFGRSFLYAAIATALALAISYPLAYFIAQRAGRWRTILLVLVVAPFFASFVLRTLAWRQLLGEQGFVVRTLHALHLLPPGATLTASATAVVLGLTYGFLPFMTLPLYAALERIDPELIEAGGDLYAGPFTTFRTITLPLSMPGVLAGTLLTFIPASGDYVNAALLGRPPDTTMIGNVVESRFFRSVDYPTAAALSFILMAAILALVVVYLRRCGPQDLV